MNNLWIVLERLKYEKYKKSGVPMAVVTFHFCWRISHVWVVKKFEKKSGSCWHFQLCMYEFILFAYNTVLARSQSSALLIRLQLSLIFGKLCMHARPTIWYVTRCISLDIIMENEKLKLGMGQQVFVRAYFEIIVTWNGQLRKLSARFFSSSNPTSAYHTPS